MKYLLYFVVSFCIVLLQMNSKYPPYDMEKDKYNIYHLAVGALFLYIWEIIFVNLIM